MLVGIKTSLLVVTSVFRYILQSRLAIWELSIVSSIILIVTSTSRSSCDSLIASTLVEISISHLRLNVSLSMSLVWRAVFTKLVSGRVGCRGNIQ